LTEVVDAYFGGINAVSPDNGAPGCGVRGDRDSDGEGVEMRDVAEVRI